MDVSPKSGVPQQDVELDQAEIEELVESGSPCSRCDTPIGNFYFTFGGSAVCERCRHGLEETQHEGSGLARLTRAALFGGLAAALSAAAWLGIAMATDREFGIVAIAVGWGVGAAVFAGSRQRGGVGYQLLAVFLTYMAIVSTYTPIVYNELVAADEALTAEELGELGYEFRETEEDRVAASTGDADPSGLQPAAEVDPVLEELTTAETVTVAAVFLLLVLAVAAAAPFLAGLQNIMGLFIIGIALYQAWSMNKKPDLTIAGPFESGKPMAQAESTLAT